MASGADGSGQHKPEIAPEGDGPGTQPATVSRPPVPSTTGSTLAVNPMEHINRGRKVGKLVRWFLEHGYTPYNLDAEAWARAIAETGVREPSEISIANVIGSLKEQQQLCADCERVAVAEPGALCADCRPACLTCGSAAEDVHWRGTVGVLLCGRCADSDEVYVELGVD